ncbi:LysR family transcriptional regulator [Pseudonocardia xishanensis]|uniref:LysR family transcriptional regulator n=1 Tax=Pseudonocardia xishanensis TaxID=630995 RepID=A0ABP8RWW2_9PSEU
MELRQLRYFVAVAEHLHYRNAAKSLHMAQPPLSQQIRRLEEDLGVELFARTSRKVELTEHGDQLLEAARRVLAEAEAMRDLAGGLRTGSAGRLRIGFVASVLNWGLAPKLGAFRKRNPGVEVTATQMPVVDQVEAIAENRIDVGFTLARLTYSHLDVRVISVERLLVVLPEDHPRASDAEVSLADLANETFLIWRAPFGPHLDDFVTRACSEAGFLPSVAYQGPQVHSVIHMVAAGFGISLVPQCDRGIEAPGVIFRELAPPTPWTVLSVVRHRHRRNPVVDRLVGDLPEIDIENVAS